MLSYPGNPFMALKHREVSSVNTAPSTSFAARRHFSFAISIGSPCSSGKSIFLLVNSNGASLSGDERICFASSSFFLFPVTKVMIGLIVDVEADVDVDMFTFVG